jgi:hypothetical protein
MKQLSRREYVLAREAMRGTTQEVAEIVVRRRARSRVEKRISPKRLEAYEHDALVRSFRPSWLERLGLLVDAYTPKLLEQVRAMRAASSSPLTPDALERQQFAERLRDSAFKRLSRATVGAAFAALKKAAKAGGREAPRPR